MTNIPNPDLTRKDYGRPDEEKRSDFERPVVGPPSTSNATMWIVLAAAVIVILAIGIYSMNRTPPVPASAPATTQIAPSTANPPALPPAVPAPAPSTPASPAQ